MDPEEECGEGGIMDCPTLASCGDDLLLAHDCAEHIDPFYALTYSMRTE